MMSWILAREEFAYFIYDQDVRPIGYFAPDYATSAEDKIIDMITDESHVKGGRLTLYLQQLPAEALSMERFVGWAQGILRHLSAWEKFQRERNLQEPQIGLERGMLSVIIEVRFDQPAKLTKSGLAGALSGILADLRSRQMI